MACRHGGVHFFSPTAVARRAGFLHHTRISLQTNKIVLPRLPNAQKQQSSSSSSFPLELPHRRSEYHENRRLDLGVADFLDDDASRTLRQQMQLEQFRTSTNDAAFNLWRDSKSHLRRQEKLVKEMGVDGAVREILQPTQTSFRQELRQRPLDRGILEEIYKGLHGRRIERRLKRGVSWEHWITKGDGTAPIFTASKKAQQTFAFGGAIQLATKATHAKQFPIILPGGKQNKNSGNGGVENMGDTLRLVPEVAFIGRTSSGKSSLINAILNAMVAPYGHLQGTTSSVNFYNVANKVVFVDCPGYGFYNPMETPNVDAENGVAVMHAYLAACSRHSNGLHIRGKKEDGREGKKETGPLVLSRVRPIRRVFVCVSSRGVQHLDISYLDRLEALGVPFSVVLTKTDAAPIRFLARLADHTRCQLVHYKHCKELMLASSLRLAGIDKIQNLIASMALAEDRLHGATTDFSAIV